MIEISWICLVEVWFNTVVIFVNRSIPVAIAVYRYIHVWKYQWLLAYGNKKKLEKWLKIYVLGESCSHIPSLYYSL